MATRIRSYATTRFLPLNISEVPLSHSSLIFSCADPPKLRGVRNFTTFNAVSEDTEHESAILECIIEETLTAGVVLEWRRNGALLQNSLKYVLLAPLSVDNSNLLVYMLVVRELAPSDMGAYECWLYSNYSFQQNRPENVLQVWILESGSYLTVWCHYLPEYCTSNQVECWCGGYNPNLTLDCICNLPEAAVYIYNPTL